jgi:hypothetical protein
MGWDLDRQWNVERFARSWKLEAGRWPMLSFASAVFDIDGTMIGTFTANLETLPDAAADPDTTVWWERTPDAWRASRSDLLALDLESFAMAVLGTEFRGISKRTMPCDWFGPARTRTSPWTTR